MVKTCSDDLAHFREGQLPTYIVQSDFQAKHATETLPVVHLHCNVNP